MPLWYKFINSRNKLIKRGRRHSLGGKLELTEKEKEVNRIFMKHKINELSLAFNDTSQNSPAMHFFKAKDYGITVCEKDLQHLAKSLRAVLQKLQTSGLTLNEKTILILPI
ncbi:hypothetical protein GQX74_014251 [Glossina fuscipes]|nr:hypothetical protein GQX74_014251 [Glossina fuscipes]